MWCQSIRCTITVSAFAGPVVVTESTPGNFSRSAGVIIRESRIKLGGNMVKPFSMVLPSVARLPTICKPVFQVGAIEGEKGRTNANGKHHDMQCFPRFRVGWLEDRETPGLQPFSLSN